MTTLKKKPRELPVEDMSARLAAVEEQVSFLLKGRPGRKYLPILASEEHVCGVDPDRNSKLCGDASLWRRNRGCLGDACVSKSTEYYRTYRQSKKEPDEE